MRIQVRNGDGTVLKPRWKWCLLIKPTSLRVCVYVSVLIFVCALLRICRGSQALQVLMIVQNERKVG